MSNKITTILNVSSIFMKDIIMSNLHSITVITKVAKQCKMPISWRNQCSHRSSNALSAISLNLALVLEQERTDYFLLRHEIKTVPRKKNLIVERRSVGSLAQSTHSKLSIQLMNV